MVLGKNGAGWRGRAGNSKNMHGARDCDDFCELKERKCHVPWLRRKQSSQKAKVTTRWFCK